MRVHRILAIVLFVSALPAADFWKQKPASDWNEKEVKQMLTKSPWAKEVALQMAGMAGGGMGGGRGMGGGGGAMGPGGGGGAMGGEMGAGGGGGAMGGQRPGGGAYDTGAGMPAMPRLLVRWDSAKPVQEAMAKAEMPLSDKAKSGEFYVVSISGKLPMGRQGNDPAELKQRILKAASLNRKGMDPLAPADVEALRDEQGLLLRFYFPKTPAIEAAQKDVTFKFEMGPVSLDAKFGLKDMVYGGDLSL